MIEILEKIGLSLNESKVYLALLELGPSLAGKITEKSKVNRRTVYDILETLIERGLVSYVIGANRKVFEAASPRKFIEILKEKEKTIAESLPQMLEIQKSVKTKPSITMYEGKEGIKTVMDQFLLEAKEFVALTPLKAMLNLSKYYFPDVFDRRVEAGIKVRLLIDGEPLRKEMMEYKIIHKKFSTGYWIYNDKVMILSFPKKNPLAIVIENQDFADSMRVNFDLAWEGAKKQV